jgi:glycosyltransferase involved in cell wall biosynthesis
MALISIGLFVYNSEKYLNNCINSILSQSFKDFKLIIVNDGSTDKSLSIINSFIDQRIVVHNHKENKGIAFRLFELTKTIDEKYFVRMDSDDIMLEHRLEVQVNCFNESSSIDFVYGDAISIDLDNNILGYKKSTNALTSENILAGKSIIHPTVMFRTEWLQINNYNKIYNGIEDLELWFRTFNDSSYKYINTPLIFYREVISSKKYFNSVKSRKLFANNYNLNYRDRFKFIILTYFKSLYTLFFIFFKLNYFNIFFRYTTKKVDLVYYNLIVKYKRKPLLMRCVNTTGMINVVLFEEIKYMADYFDIIIVTRIDSNFNSPFQKSNITFIDLKIDRKINLINDFKALINYIIIFIKYKPNIVHSMSPKSGLISMLAAKLVNVPVRIHTYTGLIFPYKKFFLRNILIVMDKITCICANVLYSDGNGVINDLYKYKVTNKKIRFINKGSVNGISENFYKNYEVDINKKICFFEENNINFDTFIFIFIGRINNDKGINELVDVFYNLNIIYSNTKLILIGPFEDDLDPITPKTKNLIESSENIITTGFQNDIRFYLELSNVLILPSYREGFPRVLLEAGIFKKPCIVSNINGNNEIIKDNFNGFIFENKNSIELMKCMLQVYSNKDNIEYLQNNAFDYIKNNFVQNEILDILLSDYNQFLERNFQYH